MLHRNLKMHCWKKMLPLCLVVMVLCCPIVFASENVLEDVVFTILSQPHRYHAAIGQETKERLSTNLRLQGILTPRVYTLHDDLPLHGGWTVFPLLPTLIQMAPASTKWFAFLSERSDVDLNLFKTVLSKFTSDYEIFVGRSLVDRESTIIHHFNEVGLEYPDFEAGFLLSRELVKTLAVELEKGPDHLNGFPKDFSIDAMYELARVISHLHDNGPRLDNEPLFCTSENASCAIKPRQVSCQSTLESRLEILSKTLFAVKTCQKFHNERLKVVAETWGPVAENIILVSEVEDSEFGTVVLPGADFNTERGHCQKTESILKYFNNYAEEKNWQWLVIADDDTILSVSKMMDLLHCYNEDHDIPIAIGQRYGFRVARGSYGYDYPTGGSSMIFNKKVVSKLMDLSATHCNCGTPDKPDDMHLGTCLANLGLSLIHSDRLHQARPNDYSEKLLEHQDPISFHKFWNANPLEIYQEWFKKFDDEILAIKSKQTIKHEEL